MSQAPEWLESRATADGRLFSLVFLGFGAWSWRRGNRRLVFDSERGAYRRASSAREAGFLDVPLRDRASERVSGRRDRPAPVTEDVRTGHAPGATIKLVLLA